MLWAIRNEWPSGAQFTFNCYRHWATLVVQHTGDEPGHFLHSKEGVTQWDPLAMIAYGIGFLPLIRELQGVHTRVTQPWYADDAGSGRKFQHILDHLQDIQERGLTRGYFLEPTNIILVVVPRNVARAEEFFCDMVLQVVMGSRYLGGFIGDGAAEKRWLARKVEVWAEFMGSLAGVSHKHPQSTYSVLQKSLQQEWAFIQRVTPGIGDAFCPVDKLLRETFFPALFEGLVERSPGRWVARLQVKQEGLALPDLTLTAPENWTVSFVITGHFVAALRRQVEFQTADHLACLR